MTIARKPFSGSAAANCLERRCGALNIGDTRVGSDEVRIGHNKGDSFSQSYKDKGEQPERTHYTTHTGRWPANVTMVHRTDCQNTGVVTVKGYTINRWSDGAKPFGGGAGYDYESEQLPDEVVPVWECASNCGVAELDSQSGYLKTGKVASHSDRGMWSSGADIDYADIEDGGGASRFFKQMQETNMNELPQELLDYLETMITTPGGTVLVALDLDSTPLEQYDDESIHGLVTQGDPTPHLDEIWRVLKPGAHVMCIAPDDQPTGHTGACALEDRGFEIRDAILIVDEPGGFHYSAKASTKERHSGVTEMVRKVEVETAYIAEGVKPEELEGVLKKSQVKKLAAGKGIAAEKVPEEAAGLVEVRTEVVKKRIANNHPTIKPRAMIEALLDDVPKDALVLDPFMGSGTAALACLRTGHDYIGIDKEAEYVKIADERVRFWDSAEASWNAATIESEATDDVDRGEREISAIEDMFGG